MVPFYLQFYFSDGLYLGLFFTTFKVTHCPERTPFMCPSVLELIETWLQVTGGEPI